jgi:2-methylcitrate dehydratase PrpD
MRDLAYDLAANAAKTNYGDLPEDVVLITKKFILDTLGCAIAGSSAPGCGGVVELVKDWGGKKESTLMLHGGKVIATHAALANSMMIQALEIDDMHEKAVLHANVTVLPAALAVAERKGNVSGKELIASVALGVDVVGRLGLGIIHRPLDWIMTTVCGYFGAAVGAGKILGMGEELLRNAMGIALTQTAGSLQTVADKVLVKRMLAGFAARGGVLAAVLAEKGITGVKNVFEGPWGFFPLYYDGKYDRDIILRGLGEHFEGRNLGVKLYMGNRRTHACIDAALDIVQENGLQADDVAEVVAHVNEASFIKVGGPFTIQENPQVDAEFSIPYAIALAIARRHVFVDDFEEERIRTDVQVLELAQKVRVIGDQGSIKDVGRGCVPCIIEIKTKNNRVYTQRKDVISGSPEQPASMEDVAEKFRKCCAFSVKPLSKKRIENIIGMTYDLENIGNISSLMKLMA